MNVRRGIPAEWRRAWRELTVTARQTVSEGLVAGTSGNLSVRVGDAILVTPSGVPYDLLRPRDLLAVKVNDGSTLAGSLAPTSELPLHLAIYRATDAGAVVHTHAVHATAVSTLVDELPAIHYITAALGGRVRVAPYATYGSAELADHMLEALRDRTACLLRNHGTVAHGPTLRRAHDDTAQLEWLARLWLTATAVPGHTPSLISPEELDRVAAKFRTYGQRRS